MNKKFLNKKAAILSVISIIALGGVLVAATPKPKADDEVRVREFPAQIGTITVGTDATGSIASNKKGQFVEPGIKIDYYNVKKGDYIMQGDIVAKYSQKDVEEKLKKAKEDLKLAEFEINKAKSDKESFISEADKKLDETRKMPDNAYNEKVAPLNARKAAAEQAIANANAQIEKLKADIASYEDAKINPPSPPPSPLPDYDALIKKANDDIALQQTQIAASQKELADVAATLAAYGETHKNDKQNADENLSVQRQQNVSTMSTHDNNIRLAGIKYTEAKEKYQKLLDISKNLDIKSENEGVVLSLGFTPQAETNDTTAIIETGARSEMYLELFVDPMDIVDVKEGQEVSFYVDAYPDTTFSGKVSKKSYLQNDSGKFGVTIIYEQTEQELFNGMAANGTLIIKQKKDVLTLQNKAILSENGKSYVNLRKEDGTLEKREIKTGFSDGRLTEITSGLNAGDIAIIEERYENL